MTARQIIRTPGGEELVVLPGPNTRHCSTAPIIPPIEKQPRTPTMSPSTMLGRPNWLREAPSFRTRLARRYFAGTTGRTPFANGATRRNWI